MAATLQTGDRRRRDELVLRVQHMDDPAAVFAEASARLRRLVPFDLSGWMATDPGTGLPVAPTLFDGPMYSSDDYCIDYWRQEFCVGDVNLFRDIARAPTPAASLRAAVDDPRRSARYRNVLQPLGVDDELRLVLRVGESQWGAVSLWRRPGQPPFTEREIMLVASLSEPLGETLRLRARPADTITEHPLQDQPGLLLFDPSGALISANDQAKWWLDELHPCRLTRATDLGVTIPLWLMGVVFHASAVALGTGNGTARARVRTRRGQWLVCHASCMRDAGGSVTAIATVIEPAKRAEIAPVLVEAYDLSLREQEITGLIVRGAGTADIADELSLSVHTVRDYIKAIFGKVNVSSRGELVGRLFAEHYLPMHTRELAHIDESVKGTTYLT
ncbi:helix-turn-helix transcriptional regulator [Actinopolymorpha sp. B11F2]|uniref:helix-turn-helix transcriptional regulator n=1 Tax=Actinopolymorpha sp. B11F2 TaxID=3160862 RepID=UPI0032E4B281